MNVTLKSRQARQNWRDLLDQVLTGVDVIIERNGKPVAVMIPVADYEAIQEELDDLRAARRAAVIYDAWKRNSATAKDWESVRADLIKDSLVDEQ